MFFGQMDMDEEPEVIMASDVDGRTRLGIEQYRRDFYHIKRNWLENRKDSNHYNMMFQVYGPKTAEASASGAEMHFRHYLENALLTEEGETTNPLYPVDRMINRELRRIRADVVRDVLNFVSNIEKELPEEVAFWTQGLMEFYLLRYINRYEKLKYSISIVIPGKKLARPRMHEVDAFLRQLAVMYSDPKKNEGMTVRYQLDRIAQELGEFILVDLPYNNERLNKKDSPIPDVGKPVEEEVKILH